MNGNDAFFYRNNQLFEVQTGPPKQEIYPNYHNYSVYSLMNHKNSPNKKPVLFVAAIEKARLRKDSTPANKVSML